MKSNVLTTEISVRRARDACSADLVLHAGAMSAIGDCARDPGLAHACNGDATGALAAGRRLVFVSTDMVFVASIDGEVFLAPPVPTLGLRGAALAALALLAAGWSAIRSR